MAGGLRALKQELGKLYSAKSDPWVDLGLTLPIFLGYHLGVVFLPSRNAADIVTSQLVRLANFSILAYMGLTVALAASFVGLLVVLGRGKKLVWKRFVGVILEGAVYAIVMSTTARFVVGSLHLAGTAEPRSAFSGLVMSLGAGFYEEVVFRVLLFGAGLALLQRAIPRREMLLGVGWAIASALIFSAWHYVGAYGDDFRLSSFVFRWVCGLAFVAIYRFRGFAPVVWCHALYDIWVLAL